MKKTASLLLVVVLSLAMMLSGCSEKEKDAYTLYTDMNKALEGVTSMDMDITMKVDMSMEGESFVLNFSGNAQQIIKSETDMEMAMLLNVDMSEFGLGVLPVASYYKDGYMYQDAMGMKAKSAMDTEAMLEQSGIEMMEFNTDAVVSSEITEVDGSKQLSFVLNGEKLTEMVDDLVAGQLSSLGVGDMDITLGDVSYTTVVDSDNMPKMQKMSLPMTMGVEGESADMTMDMTITYNSFNSINSIDFPADLGSYPEM